MFVCLCVYVCVCICVFVCICMRVNMCEYRFNIIFNLIMD